MSDFLDFSTAEFLVELKSTANITYRLRWPQDRYYGLVKSPVRVLHMEVERLVALTLLSGEEFPDKERLASLKLWLTEAAAGRRNDWPALPVLSANGAGEFEFVDGRHRCKALEELGATRVPVIVG